MVAMVAGTITTCQIAILVVGKVVSSIEIGVWVALAASHRTIPTGTRRIVAVSLRFTPIGMCHKAPKSRQQVGAFSLLLSREPYLLDGKWCKKDPQYVAQALFCDVINKQ
ncbi:MAG: hypothetical protein AAB824_02045, partial [Patescibacteria group bacterium]